MTVEQFKTKLIEKGFTESEADEALKTYKTQQSEYSRAQDKLRELETERKNVLDWGKYYYQIADEYNQFKPDIEKLKASRSTVQGTPAAEVTAATGLSKKEVLEMMDGQLKEFGQRQSAAYTNLTKFVAKASDNWRTKYGKAFDLDAFDKFMEEQKIADPERALEKFSAPEEQAIQVKEREKWQAETKAEIEKEVRSRYPDAPIMGDTQGEEGSKASNPWIADDKANKAAREVDLRNEFFAGLHEPVTK